MTLLPRGTRLVVASHNPGKVWEIRELIAPFGLEAVSAADLNLPEPEETEDTFEGNAKLKAVAAAAASGLPALADDSGLEVHALNGDPGIYSARWAGPGKDFGLAMQKVQDALDGRGADRRANFISVLCLAWPDGRTEVFEGKVFGTLVWPPRGGNGFGYDPMFQADGETLTFGEMAPEAKYAISHRTRAFAAFKAACLGDADDAYEQSSAARELEALTAAAANLSTQAELATFLGHLQADYARNGGDWRAKDVEAFLGCLQQHFSGDLREEPHWRMIARALLAGRLP